MTDQERALRDAFLSECWQPCRELPRSERAYERELHAAENAAGMGSENSAAEQAFWLEHCHQTRDNGGIDKGRPPTANGVGSTAAGGLASREGAD